MRRFLRPNFQGVSPENTAKIWYQRSSIFGSRNSHQFPFLPPWTIFLDRLLMACASDTVRLVSATGQLQLSLEGGDPWDAGDEVARLAISDLFSLGMPWYEQFWDPKDEHQWYVYVYPYMVWIYEYIYIYIPMENLVSTSGVNVLGLARPDLYCSEPGSSEPIRH